MPKTVDEVDMHFGGTGLTPGNLGAEDLVEVTSLVQEDFTTDWRKPINSCSSSPSNAHQSVPRLAAHTTFSSWKLESALTDYLNQSRAQGYLPTDEQLRAKARAIVGAPITSADDPKLLQKFKEFHGMASRPIHPNGAAKNGTVDFAITLRAYSAAPLTNNSNMDAHKLTAHWVPAEGRSGINVARKQYGHEIHSMQHNNSAPNALPVGFSAPLSRDNYHNNIDPQLWGNKELAAGLAGAMGRYGSNGEDKNMMEG
jgi:hypothetical protein